MVDNFVTSKDLFTIRISGTFYRTDLVVPSCLKQGKFVQLDWRYNACIALCRGVFTDTLCFIISMGLYRQLFL